MAEPSTNNIATRLENLLRILKEEHVFDRSEDQRVIQFLHPEELQVNITSLNCRVRKLVSCSLIHIYSTTLHLTFFLLIFFILMLRYIIFYILILYLLIHICIRIFVIGQSLLSFYTL